jgi:SAM-dependent methyltransferase
MSGIETFGDTSFWIDYGTTPDYIERIGLIRSMIPDDVGKLLDIGCGRGDVINALAQAKPVLKVVGIDPFLEAMHFLTVPGIQAVLPRIPFGNKAFDLVICLQVLEHLNVEDYLFALDEIQRLAKKYIIIGVPYKENLLTLQVQCSTCGQISHAYGHVRRFDRQDLVSLLSEFIEEDHVLAGVVQRRYSTLGMKVEHAIANIYHHPEIFTCPHCHGHVSAGSNHFFMVRWGAKLLSKVLTRLSPPMPYWAITLYKRKEQDPDYG